MVQIEFTGTKINPHNADQSKYSNGIHLWTWKIEL